MPHLRVMEDTATDYKLLYDWPMRQALAAHKKSLELISETDQQIQELNFELDKYKRYIFGKKNEKLTGVHTDVNQIDLFELGTDQHQQEELSEHAVEVVKEKAPAKKREKEQAEWCFCKTYAVKLLSLNPQKMLPAALSSEKKSQRFWI